MTEQPQQQLEQYEMRYSAVNTQADQWESTCVCNHGNTVGTTYLANRQALDPTAMVQRQMQNHSWRMPCQCYHVVPTNNVSVNFQPANQVQPGQLRLVPQSSASVVVPNFVYGPPLTCQKLGSYVIDMTTSLSRNLAAGARGIGHIMIGERSAASAVMVDVNDRATATVSVMTNLRPGQFVLAAYENTSGQVQDVQATTLKVGSVWVPA